MASALLMSSLLPMVAVKHTLQDGASPSYNADEPGLTVPDMDERANTLSGRIRIACENAGHFVDDSDPAKQAAARKALQAAAGWTSRMAVSEWLSESPPQALTVKSLLGIAKEMRVDVRWLATGEGEMLPKQLPSDVLDVARLLDRIQDPKLRRAAVALARVIAVDPIGQMATSVSTIAETQRWTPNVQHIADGLEAIEDDELKRLAIAWATRAAFNPEQLPREIDEPPTPQRRATDRRPEKT
jgi:hypothetical protein